MMMIKTQFVLASLFQAVTGQLNTFSPVPNNMVYAVAANDDFLFSSYNGYYYQQHVGNMSLVRSVYAHSGQVWALAVSGGSVFTGGNDAFMKQWNISTGNLINSYYEVGGGPVKSIVVDNGMVFFSGYAVQWRQISNGTLIKSISGSPNLPNDVKSIAANGDFVFAGLADGKLRQFHIGNATLARSMSGSTSSINSIVVSGEFVVAGSSDSNIRLWRISDGALNVSIANSHSGQQVYAVAVSGEHIFSGSYDNLIKRWHMSNGTLLQALYGHSNSVNSLSVWGDFLYSGGNDKTTKRWRASTGAFLLAYGNGKVSTLAATNDAVFTSGDLVVVKWQLSTKTPTAVLAGHTGQIYSIAIGGDFVFSASDDWTVKQWNVGNGTLVRTLIGHTGAVMGVVANGEFIFSCSLDKNIKQWRISDGLLVRNFTAPSGISGISVFGDFVYGICNGVMQWQISTGQSIRNFSASVSTIVANGEFLFTGFNGGSDYNIKQWALSNGSVVRNLYHGMWINQLAISGDFLYSAGQDNTVKLWRISTGAIVRSHSTSNSPSAVAVGGYFVYIGVSATTYQFCGPYATQSGTTCVCDSGTYNSGSACVPCPANSVCTSDINFTCNSGFYFNGVGCAAIVRQTSINRLPVATVTTTATFQYRSSSSPVVPVTRTVSQTTRWTIPLVTTNTPVVTMPVVTVTAPTPTATVQPLFSFNSQSSVTPTVTATAKLSLFNTQTSFVTPASETVKRYSTRNTLLVQPVVTASAQVVVYATTQTTIDRATTINVPSSIVYTPVYTTAIIDAPTPTETVANTQNSSDSNAMVVTYSLVSGVVGIVVGCVSMLNISYQLKRRAVRKARRESVADQSLIV